MTDNHHSLPARTYHEGDDTRALRDAFGCFATGVTIVTTAAPDGSPVGLTVSSFASVSLDPPLLLVCPARNAGSANLLETAESFAVNVLGSEDKDLSTRFAMKGADRFVEGDWATSELGNPVLQRALATFECRRHAIHDGGDHLVLIGRILHARYHSEDDPLLYYRSQYRGIHID
ncbi:flavin reductase family protein [Parerythrobacter jejuensis]|uniref:Flavin reductase n=1 Tax=Parerythrobacter jejuensis TaxID=795812 RepID=A0A845AUH8_9SPHN|nr:flavin reductase family protein [Parerythrobacter jejuensis]MXP32957.1 flavin reductase [Parerythrobacter jejuensis]